MLFYHRQEPGGYRPRLMHSGMWRDCTLTRALWEFHIDVIRCEGCEEVSLMLFPEVQPAKNIPVE